MRSMKPDQSRQNRHRVTRWVVLGLVALIAGVVGFLHQHPLGGWTPPGVDALCPFGGLESLWAVLFTGDMMTKIAASSFILLVGTVAVTLVFRRSFCGQICPLGTLQGAMAGIGNTLFRTRFRLPAAIDRPLRGLKYVVLAAVTGLTWMAGSLIVRPYDPWVAFMHLSSDELWTGFGVGAAVLIGSLVASLFVDRFFCRYLCPMGAFYGLVSKLGWFRVRRHDDHCIHCGQCDRACPVALSVSQSTDVSSAECLACGLCVNACPAPGALAIEGPRRHKISPLTLTLATTAVLAAVIALTAIPGWFGLSTPNLAQVSVSQNTASEQFDPNLIKGRHTLAEVVDQTQIPLKAFEDRFGAAVTVGTRPLKDLAAENGFTMDELRIFVAQQLGIVDFQSNEP